MALYLERSNREPYSAEELRRLEECVENDSRFYRDASYSLPPPNSGYLYVVDGHYAIHIHPDRIQVNPLLSKDPIIQKLIEIATPDCYLQDASTDEEIGPHPIQQLMK